MAEREGIHAGPIGRGLRLVTGVLILVAGVGPPLLDSGAELWVATFGVVLAEFAFYVALHLFIQRFVPRLNPWIGAVLAVAPVAIVFLLSDAPGRLGTLVFIGVSLLLPAWRADGGCEVMTMPGLVFGKRTHLVCIAFSPIDWLERAEEERA